MVPPDSDREPTEEEWRARMFKSKKALPRPYKPTPKRILAPRPAPPPIQVQAHEDEPRSDGEICLKTNQGTLD
jgi:hypothetical protein